MRVVVDGHVRSSPSQSHPPHLSWQAQLSRRSFVVTLLQWLQACQLPLVAWGSAQLRGSPAAYWAGWATALTVRRIVATSGGKGLARGKLRGR